MSKYITAESPKELLGEIKKYMYVHDITQDDLANKLGKSKQSISLIFSNGNPTMDTVFDILDALEIKMEYRFSEKEKAD